LVDPRPIVFNKHVALLVLVLVLLLPKRQADC
jgi:hypothetical protein